MRFADDVLLFSTSLKKLRDMLCDFKTSTEEVGLGIHPDKTKILSDQDNAKEKEITVDNIKIEILRKSDSARYLGQKVTFEDQETEEVKNRLKAAWAAFHKYRQELTSKGYRLCHILRLFQYGHHSYDDLSKWHMDSHAEARKNDQNSATKDASPFHTDKKEIQEEKEVFK